MKSAPTAALLCALCLLGTFHPSPALAADAKPVQLTSPDGQFQAQVFIAESGSAAYKVDWQGQPLIVESALGLDFDGVPDLTNLEITGQTTAAHDETWSPVCGERAKVRDHYNEVTVEVKEKAAPGRHMQWVFRAYDSGVAFQCRLPVQPELDRVVLKADLCEFRFSEDYPCWVTQRAQGHYRRLPLSKIPGAAERPLLVEAGPERFVALAEAKLVDSARTKFTCLPDGKPGVMAHIEATTDTILPMASPWRVIMAAPSPARLLANNDLIPNLNDPCAIQDTSWIKPGKVLRDLSLTNEGARRTVDYCAAHGIAYVLFDAGWYGPEESPASDAVRPKLDPRRSKGPFDVQDIIRYAESKKVGVILYVNYIAMNGQLKEILPLYRKWGVKGVKYGYVDVGSRYPTDFVNHAIRLAAENELMVDIHDEWRPTGTQRTWPNLMTCEGIAGDEEGQRSNEQSLVFQYARFIAGPADNTVCYFDERIDRLTNHAYQLAKSVCFFSPWQCIHWYDRPAKPGEKPVSGDRVIGDEPELVFFDHLPTAWDDTRVIDGDIAKFSAIARRKGDGWWLGCMNAQTPRTLQLKLDFLTAGRKYEAAVYSHDPTVATRTHVKIARQSVTAETVLTVELGKNDGQAVEIVPAKE